MPDLTKLPTDEELQHYPDLSGFWGHDLPSMTPGYFDLELLVRPEEGKPWVNIDAIAESIEWREETSALEGTLVLKRPEIDDPTSMPVGVGMDVQLRVWWGGRWYELWEMRVQGPEGDAPVSEDADGNATVYLLDDLDFVRRTVRDFIFIAPRGSAGYTCDEIARMVCEKINVPVGYLEKGKRRIKRVVMRQKSAIEVIQWAYELERIQTGIKYLPRMENGKLCVFPWRRNPILYVLGDMLTELSNERLQNGRPVTVITGKGHIGSGKTARNVEYVGYNEAAVRRFGSVHHEQEMGRVEDMKDLRDRVTRSLASELRHVNNGSFTTPGIPFIRRLDSVELNLPEFGWKGPERFTWVNSIAHTATAGSYTTTMQVANTETFAQYRREVEAKQREQKRKERSR